MSHENIEYDCNIRQRWKPGEKISTCTHTRMIPNISVATTRANRRKPAWRPRLDLTRSGSLDNLPGITLTSRHFFKIKNHEF